jgi:hypothetical protein
VTEDEMLNPAHALQFDGCKQFKVSGEMTAKMTAAHLVEQI